ncbi:protein Shroom3 isoform X2 [Leuresthes tenuis]|uniref:protein Shroom3 isoform X2 n=1 Tax=Leuresthes tenuis TaxID=355514 RepID=UPI003B50A730
MESGCRAGLKPAGGGGEGGGWVLVEARLQGGAPWGFTLQGGLEHGEPLIISKVEEGGKADRLEQPLLVGDEIIVINDVELSGYRQEAIALVKGSYKTLKLTVRREFDPGYIEEFVSLPNSLPSPVLPSPPPLSFQLPPSSPPPQHTTPSSSHSRRCSAVQLRIKNRRSEPASRPHSWHSTKLDEGGQKLEEGAMDTMSSAWPHSYHASASTTDLSGGFDSGGGYLRKSPDQYSSRGSMESLDPPLSSQNHSIAQHQHPLGHHGHTGPHSAYSSCHQLSSARSSNSIDHLHSKRDSAYSSFSTSSSIPEYLASTPSFSPERSYSLETVPQKAGGSAEMLQADIRYVRTVYDAQQGLSQEHELSSNPAALLSNSDTRGAVRSGQSRDLQVGGVRYRGTTSGKNSGSNSSGVPASNRHSVGPIWGPTASHSSYESLRGAPAPPRRSDSYAAIRNHERPNSWSSLEHARSLRSLQKGSGHHSSGPVASARGSYGAEGQLHTVIEKSPESSPTTKPRQGGGYPQPPSPTAACSGPPAPTSQSNRLILPTSVYPVPQPEPHYAQMPGCSPSPGPSGVYPSLAKESNRQQAQGLQAVSGREEAGPEGRRGERTSATENGHQNNTSSPYPRSSVSTSSSTQLRTRAHEADRHQQQQYKAGPCRPHMKAPGGESEGQTGAQRPLNHQGTYSQGFQGSHSHTSQGLHQEQNQEYHNTRVHTGHDPKPPSSQERSDPHTLVQFWGDRSRSVDQSSVHSEPVTSPRLAQGQVPQCHMPLHPQAPPTSASQPSARHFSDSAATQYQPWNYRDQDREHPLTRLENALAEVQRCASPDSVFSGSSHDNSCLSDGNQGPARSLSVLEKVSRFERRERSGKPCARSNSHKRAAQLQMTEKGRGASCGAEDLRNMLERSTKGIKVHRTMSYRGGINDHIKYRIPGDPMSALQRSRSSFQLHCSKDGDANQDLPLRQEVQEITDPLQDTSSNRSYRESLKDVQSNVLWSTSFRRRDFSSSVSPPAPAAPPTVSSSGSQQPPPVPTKYHSLEKKGPKTLPKPLGVVITPQSLPSVTSPHTPKERYVVSPDIRGPSPPALPSVPPVGPLPVARICGRKRLTADQKKRSYSEPENMNEVGVSDAETAALFRRGGGKNPLSRETSVADRRKIFELAASRVGAPQSAMSKPDLRQVRQEALFEYVERKRGARREETGQRGGARPRSAYVQPEPSSLMACYSDSISLSSTSSLLSLQDYGPDGLAGERHLCSSHPPGTDLRSLQSNLFYPGRVTTPRPPAHPSPSPSLGSTLEIHAPIHQDLTPEAGLSRRSQSCGRKPSLDHSWQTAEPQLNLGRSKQLRGALQKAGKSASAEDLLERSEDRAAAPQHVRSRSSPIVEKLNQDFHPADIKTFDVSFSEPGRCALAADRPADIHTPGGLASPRSSPHSEDTFVPAGPAQDLSRTPVTRRERQRNSERQRAHSTSTLAASVGLPCPFSPPQTQDGGSAEWKANERLSQANLDAIMFPEIPQTSTNDDVRTGGSRETLTDRQTRHSLSDGSVLEERPKEACREEAFSLEMSRRPSADVSPVPAAHGQLSSSGSSTSVHQHLSSLRISESSQQPSEPPAGVQPEDFDEVFLQNPDPPPPPSPPTSPVKEPNAMEDFPPPPPPVELSQAAEQSLSSDLINNNCTPAVKPSLRSSPAPKPQPSTPTSAELSFEYQPLPKRQKTPEELRVEALARRLVLQDPSLAPLLDTWGGKSTVDLMEEIFPNSRQTWQHRASADDRIQDGVSDAAQSAMTDQGNETDLDEQERDVNIRKVALCGALRSSVAALQREKTALCEEQRRHQALGASIETLVQERLKANERDKYSMFIGDLEKIVNLLLSLCSRLSRIDRSLLALQREELMSEDAAEERVSLHHKRSLLLRQTEDARELKENLERRQCVVHAILSGYLSEPQLHDYGRFVSAKPSLLIRQRHLDDLIRQGEEQLKRLEESLPAELMEAPRLSSPTPCSSLLPPVRSTTVTSL